MGAASTDRDRPVNFVSWGDAARFCNWLHNGQPSGPQGAGTTERGSYTLDGATTNDRYLSITRSATATYVLPTEDEWYKAAYYDPTITGANAYWSFATRSNVTPSNQLLTPDPGNNANFYQDGQYTLRSYLRTDVGDFENSSGPWGTFDQMGNVGEWTETVRDDAFAVRGESYSTGDSGGATIGYRFVRAVAPADEETKNGFRVAFLSPATVISVADGQALTQTQAGHPLISGAEFRKAGDGTLVLTAANPLTGPTSIAAGSLHARGGSLATMNAPTAARRPPSPCRRPGPGTEPHRPLVSGDALVEVSSMLLSCASIVPGGFARAFDGDATTVDHDVHPRFGGLPPRP